MSEFLEDRSVLARTSAAPDEVVRYGELAEHIADIRFGTGNAALRPLIILIHGGFWRPPIDRSHTGPMADAIAAANWSVASIEYRRIPGNPDATLDDVADAISRLPALTKHHNGNAVVIGHSAGGHLALWAALQCAKFLIGAVALGPASDLQYGYDHAIGNGAVLAFLGTSPKERSNVDPCVMPPPSIATTIVHGVQDATAPIAMSENYVARHPNTRFVRLENCGHFAVIDPLSPVWPRVIEELDILSAK